MEDNSYPSCSSTIDDENVKFTNKMSKNDSIEIKSYLMAPYKMSTFIFYLMIIFTIINPVNSQFNNNDFDIFRYKCPDKCICVPDVVDTNLLIITCQIDYINEDKTFNDYPKNVTKSLTIKCLSHQHDSIYSDDMFQGFKQLKDLRINNCHTKDLPTNTFRGLRSLKSLYMSKLTNNKTPPSMAFGLFKPVSTLEKLTLTESMIRQFPDGFFCPLIKLQILNVISNRLTSMKINTESNPCQLHQLIILDISDNLIETIESTELSAMPNLRQLSIKDNDLIEIQKNSFSHVPTLQHIDFENNHLSELPELPQGVIHLNLAKNRFTVIPGTVSNCNKLISLNMSHNNVENSTPFTLTSEILETIDLSYNKFDSIPIRIVEKSLASLLYLHLQGNAITVIQPYQLQNLTRLQKLDLSNNLIKTLNDDCFSGLNELIELIIKNNSIYHIDVGVFNDVSKNLQKIDFSSNLLIELPIAIGKLKKIKYMDFSNNQISKMYKFVLNKLIHLIKLNLNNNKLLNVESYIFSNCQHLVELNLSNNRIDALAQDSFEKCSNLKYLDLSQNKISTFSSSLNGLKNLRYLNISSNNLDMLEWNELPDELLNLDVSLNKIYTISQSTKSHVKVVNLKSNKLMHISKNQLCDEIEEIDLSSNDITSLEKETFTKLKSIKSINLQNNKLKNLSLKIFKNDEISLLNGLLTTYLYIENNPLECTCDMSWITKLNTKTSLQILDIYTTRCKNIFNNEIIKLSVIKESEYLCKYEQTCEPSCICCQYGNCDCKSKCPNDCLCYHDIHYKINIVKCKNDNITTLSNNNFKRFKPRIIPMHATHIYIENLNIPILESHDFMSRIKLKELMIYNSNVKIIQPLSFNTLPNLEKLDLSYNKLKELRGDELYKVEKVQELKLNDNLLDKVDVKLLDNIPNLNKFHIKNNQFKLLPEILLVKNDINDIQLSGNPFRCDCNYKRFKIQTFILNNRNRITDINDIECVENVTLSFINNDTTIFTGFLPNYDNDLFKMPILEFLDNGNQTICKIEANGIFGGSYQQNILLIVSSIIFTIATIFGLILIVISIFKKNNNKNRYIKAPPSLNCSTTPGSSPLPMPLIQYDAFISYSKKDESTVVNQLCRRLEDEDYSLCLLHQEGSRHAYHGSVHNISDELIHQMEACNVLIIYLTKNFLENEWQTVQIKTAHRFFSKKRNKKLITIISDEIKPNELDSELGKILRSNTRLKFNDQIFWKLLLNAMPLKTNSQHSSGSTILGDGSDIYSEMYGTIVPSEIV